MPRLVDASQRQRLEEHRQPVRIDSDERFERLARLGPGACGRRIVYRKACHVVMESIEQAKDAIRRCVARSVAHRAVDRRCRMHRLTKPDAVAPPPDDPSTLDHAGAIASATQASA